jgi:hypothetical protein
MGQFLDSWRHSGSPMTRMSHGTPGRTVEGSHCRGCPPGSAWGSRRVSEPDCRQVEQPGACLMSSPRRFTRAVARSWLAISCVTATSGCIVAEPPDYQSAAKTRPMLDLSMADPPVTEVVSVDTTAPRTVVPFNLPVRSEDAGDDLLSVFYLSFGQADQSAEFGISEEPASTFDDTGRVIARDWDYGGLEPGCYQLTMVVTHKSNFDLEAWSPTDSADVAIATWWVNVDDDPAQPNLLSQCPSQTSGGGQ